MRFFCLLHKGPSGCRSTKGEYSPSEEAIAWPPQTALLHTSAPDGMGQSGGGHGPLRGKENKHLQDQPRETKVNDLHSLECKKQMEGSKRAIPS